MQRDRSTTWYKHISMFLPRAHVYLVAFITCTFIIFMMDPHTASSLGRGGHPEFDQKIYHFVSHVKWSMYKVCCYIVYMFIFIKQNSSKLALFSVAKFGVFLLISADVQLRNMCKLLGGHWNSSSGCVSRDIHVLSLGSLFPIIHNSP